MNLTRNEQNFCQLANELGMTDLHVKSWAYCHRTYGVELPDYSWSPQQIGVATRQVVQVYHQDAPSSSPVTFGDFVKGATTVLGIGLFTAFLDDLF